ncbi:MAG TPA: 30S ribosomal protein S6 [Pyrinomonadaceae bacterium]|nr:30S ribosomal protein S6 [Pyrinomonadaceae bacterium]
MAVKRTYEVMYIGTPETSDDDITKLNEAIEKMITDDGGSIVKTEAMGRRKLAYPINKKTEGHYTLFEIEGSGQEIAELERRMRVNDTIMRYMTVRVDEERKTAEKHRSKREDRQNKRKSFAGGNESRETTAGDNAPENQ